MNKSVAASGTMKTPNPRLRKRSATSANAVVFPFYIKMIDVKRRNFVDS